MKLLKDELMGKSNVSAAPALKRTDVTNHRAIIARFQSLLPKAEAIVADSVVESFYADHPKEFWDYQEDYSCVSPPFPLFFIETKRPSVAWSEVRAVDAKLLPERWGVLYEAISPKHGWTAEEINTVSKRIGIALTAKQWMYAVNFVYLDEQRGFVTPQQTWFFLVDEQGKIVRNPKILSVPEWVKFPQELTNLWGELMSQFAISSLYVLNAIIDLKVQLVRKHTPSIVGTGSSPLSSDYYILTA